MEPRDDEIRPPRSSLAERVLASLPGLTRFVRRRMGADLAARESASDIVQSTCRELLRSASTFEDRGEASFQRWVQSAAEHKLQNRARHWRAERRDGGRRSIELDARQREGDGGDDERSIDPSAPSSSRPSQDAMLREEAERLSRAFRALPQEYRFVLTRSQIDGASQAEIAHEMNRSPEAVRKLLARAMAQLSAALETSADSSDRANPADQSGRNDRTGRTPIM
jgi:RNA polymerase sigma factor (sigma-70 family)